MMKNFLKNHKLEIISTLVFVLIILFACVRNFGTPKSDSKKEYVSEKRIVTQDDNKSSSSADTKPEKDESGFATAKEKAKKSTCSFSVNCRTVLNNIDNLKSSKKNLVPKDGSFLLLDKAEFAEGESAFDVLHRELEKNNIDIEYSKIPGSDTVYIKSIGGLGEFDCGSTSGWLYKVNGEMASVSASEYILKKGDKVEFLYTCEMGDI